MRKYSAKGIVFTLLIIDSPFLTSQSSIAFTRQEWFSYVIQLVQDFLEVGGLSLFGLEEGGFTEGLL